MKKIRFFALCLLLSTPAMADIPVFGDGYAGIKTAKAVVAKYSKHFLPAVIDSIDRSRVTGSGGPGACNPVAWVYTFVTDSTVSVQDQSSATVTVYEEAYASYDSGGNERTTCQIATHFQITDGGLMDTASLSDKDLKGLLTVDKLAAIARRHGLAQVDAVTLKLLFYPGAPSDVVSVFAGKDAAGNVSSVGVNARTGDIVL